MMARNLLPTSLSHRFCHKDEKKGWILIKTSVHGSSKCVGCAFDKASFAARSARAIGKRVFKTFTIILYKSKFVFLSNHGRCICRLGRNSWVGVSSEQRTYLWNQLPRVAHQTSPQIQSFCMVCGYNWRAGGAHKLYIWTGRANPRSLCGDGQQLCLDLASEACGTWRGLGPAVGPERASVSDGWGELL